jgi:hypothetical protein
MDRARSWTRSTRSSGLDRDAEEVWSAVAAAGPGPHWYVDALPLVLRGALDRAVGGQGRRWPVPDARLLRTGDKAGFWRVAKAGRLSLELVADVRSPGRVSLMTSVLPRGASRCVLQQSVAFEAGGLLGLVYLLADLPARELVMELVHRRVLADVARS